MSIEAGNLTMEHTAIAAPGNTLLPPFEQTREFVWSHAEAKRLGIYGFDSRDIRSRSFNLLRSRLLKMHRAKGARLFGIVSATPGVGKSFIATNLAAAVSRTPTVRTNLVDLDLRRGSVSRNFGYAVEQGVRSYLDGSVDDLSGIAFRLANERLLVIPSDRSDAHSAELLSNERLSSMLASFRADDADSIFLFDLPPVFANDDAAIVTAKLDAYVLVVEDGRTTRKQIKESLHMLDRSRCAGVVLNRYSGGMVSDTYGYSYGSSKAYGKYFGS